MLDDLRRAGLGGYGGVGHHPGLLVVDATLAFTDSASPLVCDSDEAVTAIATLLSAARKASACVVFSTVVVGPKERRAAAQFLRKMPGLLSIADDPNRSMVDPRIAPRAEEVVIEKIFPSVFFGSSLHSILSLEQVDTVVVTGMSTSGCVRATAVDALQHGFRPVVVRDAVADRDPSAHAATLHDLEMKYADVISLEDAVGLFEDHLPAAHDQGDARS
jgi:nicotinamidase-related amidase